MSDGLPQKAVPLAFSLEQAVTAACRTAQATEPTDMELVTQFQKGSEAAFDALVRRHQQRAFNIAFGMLHEREDALEVAQDAFVRAYRALKDFRGESAFTTWLFRIITNLAHNKTRWHRARHSQVHVSLDAPADPNDPNGRAAVDLRDPNYGPDRQTMVSEETRCVGAAIQKLGKNSREILILRNVENLSYEDIAQVLDCNIGTVKSRINRAREELRVMLKDWNE